LKAQNSIESHDNNQKKYISSLNTFRNPDLLMPGAKFLKGSLYFKELVTENTKEESQKEEGQEDSSSVAAQSEEGVDLDAEFEKMKNQ
jgi:hypothetical protein